MRLIGRGIRALNSICNMFAGALLLFMTLFLCVNIVGRNFVGHSYIGTDAVGTWSMAWITFLGAATIVPAHGHVCVDLLMRATGNRPGLKRPVVIVTAVVGMVTSAILGYLGVQFTHFIFSTGQVETTLGISPGFLYMALAIGMIVMFLNYADLLVAMLRKDDSRLPVSEVEAAPVTAPGDHNDA